MNRLARNFAKTPLAAAIWLQIAMFVATNAAISIFEGTLGLPEWLTAVATEGLFVIGVLFLIGQLGWWRAAGFSRPAGSKWLWLAAFGPALTFVANGFATRLRGPLAPTFIIETAAVSFSEELSDRGLILAALARRGIPSAVILSAAIFGLSHLSNALYSPLLPVLGQVAATSGAGAVWAVVRLRSGSIWPVVLGHFAADLVASRYGFDLANDSAAALTVDLVETAVLWTLALLMLRGLTRSAEPTTESKGATA